MRRILAMTAAALMLCACGIYSFSGTSIQPDVKTVTIDLFEYRALKVNPSLANNLTEAFKTKFRKLTKLEQVEEDGDIELSGDVVGYDVSAQAITAGEVASKNRLTVTIKAKFTNRKYPEDDFEQTFSAYADFDATQTMDSVQDALCEEIIDKIVEEVFNASVAKW